jgi:hypothetical protein
MQTTGTQSRGELWATASHSNAVQTEYGLAGNKFVELVF